MAPHICPSLADVGKRQERASNFGGLLQQARPEPLASNSRMVRRVSFFSVLLLLAIAAVALLAKTPGVFRGTIVRIADAEPGWLYLRAVNGNVRRVALESARIVYAESVPQRDRDSSPKLSLREGAELRVTAEQDGNGEWHASLVEILSLGEKSKNNIAVRGGWR